MKKCMGWIIIMCMVSLWGCGGRTDGAGASASGKMGTGAAMGTGASEEESLLVSGMDDTMKGLYNVSHGSVLEAADGTPVKVTDLQTGMMVDLTWGGDVMEIYPSLFTYDKLRVTQKKGSRELELYKQLVRELAKADPGLNDGITQSFFDLTGVSSLTEDEKEGLAYIGGGYFGTMGIQMTREELAEQGVLDPVKGIENGILITIEETSRDGDRLTCNVEKYRSGTGAYYFHDVKAVYENDRWTYTIGAHMIS